MAEATRRITVRVGNERLARWREAAEVRGVTVSELTLDAVDRLIAAGGDPPADRRELARLRRELAAIGNNLNQLAHAYNRDGQLAPAVVEAEAEAVAEVRHAITRVLAR